MQAPGNGRRFTAELELCEIDARVRSGTPWSARATAISHSRLWVRSRRMCYPGVKVVSRIHHIDDEPFVLVGEVVRCEYDADGMYAIEIALEAAQNRSALGKQRTTPRVRQGTLARG